MAQPFHLSDREHNQLVLRIEELVSQLERMPDQKAAGQVRELLESIDLVHREALHRLLQMIQSRTPELFPALLEDPAVQTLLLLYDFAPEPSEKEEPRGGEGFVPLSELQVPVWVPAGRTADFPERELVARQVNQHNLLMCRLQGDLYALENRCLDSILPLQLGRVDGRAVVCPWHGCRYDLHSGKLIGTERGLPTFPVRVSDEGIVRVGFNITGPRAR